MSDYENPPWPSSPSLFLPHANNVDKFWYCIFDLSENEENCIFSLKVFVFFTITEFEFLIFVKLGEIIDLNNDSDQADYGVDVEDRVGLEIPGDLFKAEFKLGLMTSSDWEIIIFYDLFFKKS